MMIYAALGIGFMGVLFGAGLAVAARRFAVEVDPREEKLGEILPNANCGACGYPDVILAHILTIRVGIVVNLPILVEDLLMTDIDYY